MRKSVALPPAPGPALPILLHGVTALCWLVLFWPVLDTPFLRFLLAMLIEALGG